jgi:hypothetical protein
MVDTQARKLFIGASRKILAKPSVLVGELETRAVYQTATPSGMRTERLAGVLLAEKPKWITPATIVTWLIDEIFRSR